MALSPVLQSDLLLTAPIVITWTRPDEGPNGTAHVDYRKLGDLFDLFPMKEADEPKYNLTVIELLVASWGPTEARILEELLVSKTNNF
jgi:hypothetical protein